MQAKLSPPPMREGSVVRHDLLRRLAASDAAIVSVVAPPGYGKTTLLTQAAANERRPVAWVSLDGHDDDPTILVGLVAGALHGIAPIDPTVFQAMATPRISPWSAATHLSMALEHHPAITLMIDDADAIAPGAASDVLAMLPGHLPAGSRLVLSARTSPAIDLSRSRAAGDLLELGPRELALRDDEALALATGAGLLIDAAGAQVLNRQAEGWPAGLYLGIKAIQVDGPTVAVETGIAGDRRFVEEYLRSEILDRLPADQAELLRRTSFLERFNGPLCDAVLDRPGSGSVLAEIERTNRFLIPLDDRGQWYRCHHLLRDALRAELAREPAASGELLGRASAWFEANELYEEAIDLAFEAGDTARIARLMTRHTQTLHNLGRTTTVRRLFDRLGAETWVPDHPEVAVVAAIFFATLGDPRRAAQWAHLADGAPHDRAMPDGSPSIDAWLALLRAIMAQDGLDRLRDDSTAAVASIPPTSPWRTATLTSRGMAHYLAGELDQADAMFDAADSASMPPAAATARSIAMAYRAVIAIEGGDWTAAAHHAASAREAVVRNNLADNSAAIMAYAVSARVSMRRGNRVQAEADRAHANRLRPGLSTAMPWLAVGARLELARICLAESDAAGARTLLREADGVLRVVPDLGRLTADVAEVRRQAEDATGIAIGASALTTAELRLLPYLGTHLSFPEIAERLTVSTNTIKTQAMSVYRKLDVTSRSEAVARAAAIGLTDPIRDRFPSAID